MHLISDSENEAITELLIVKGVDADVINNHGDTALIIAAANGKILQSIN